jgi:futalosine hydrolase
MKVLIVAATEFEIRPLLTQMTETARISDRLTSYLFLNHPVDVLIPGVGMLVTAYHLGRQLLQVPYDLAINAGIAGSFREEIPIGEVVEVVEDCVTELGAEDGKEMVSVFELGLEDPDSYPYSGGRLVNDRMLMVPALQKLPKVRGSTVNTIHGAEKLPERVRGRTEADVESMEGAAFLYSCLSAGLPGAQIRSISNRVAESDKSNWDVNLSLRTLNKSLREILDELLKP